MKYSESLMKCIKTIVMTGLILIICMTGKSVDAIQDDFSSDSGLWTYEGVAYRDLTNEYVVLTSTVNWQWGQIWLNEDINEPFSVKFSYLAGGGSGADGFVLMFYKKFDFYPDYGGSLGFSATPHASRIPVPGYGIEFDNHFNGGGYNDISDRHIALIKDQPGNHLTTVVDPRTEDFQWHDVEVIVEESSITVFVDGSELLSWSGIIDISYGGIGFSAATGGLNNWHIIDDVSIEGLVEEVVIDIKPGSDTNNINLSSAGVIPVAILSSDTFDATTVNPDTVSLAGARVKMVGKADKYLCSDEDVNADGLLDKLCKVYTAYVMIEPGESEAVLEAETFDGISIRGTDNVQIVPDQ